MTDEQVDYAISVCDASRENLRNLWSAYLNNASITHVEITQLLNKVKWRYIAHHDTIMDELLARVETKKTYKEEHADWLRKSVDIKTWISSQQSCFTGIQTRIVIKKAHGDLEAQELLFEQRVTELRALYEYVEKDMKIYLDTVDRALLLLSDKLDQSKVYDICVPELIPANTPVTQSSPDASRDS